MAEATRVYERFAEYYDHVVPYLARTDVPFFVEAARDARGPVLELGCGTGRILIPTARAGCEITGLDLSAEMLAVCRERLAGELSETRRRVQVAEGDMRAFNLPAKFRLVTVPFRGFLHLHTAEDQLAALACIHRHLEPGGNFILDVFDPYLPVLFEDKYLNEFNPEPEFSMPDGRRVVRSSRIAARDLGRQLLDCELIYSVTHSDGRAERLVDAFRFRYIFRHEAEHLLARAGFALESVYCDYDKTPFGSKYPAELICVARKP